MSEFNDGQGPDRTGGDFEDALRARIEAQLAQVTPDFEGLMQRVEHTAQDALEDLEALEPPSDAETELDTNPEIDTQNRHDLRPYVSAYRDRLDAVLEQHPVPTKVPNHTGPRPSKRSASKGERGAWWLGLVAAAAIILAFVGFKSGLGFQTGTQAETGHNAVDQARNEAAREEASTSAPPIQRPRVQADTAPSQADEPPQDVLDAETQGPEEPTAEVAAPEKIRKTVTPASVDEKIAALDAAAQADWRQGDRRSAAKKFQRIVSIGGRRPAVELAYGELFALNRQLGDSPIKLWKAYLKRFPRGRYAEDAQAGLCRRSSAASSARCWDEYAERFPRGAHLEEARKAADPPSP